MTKAGCEGENTVGKKKRKKGKKTEKSIVKNTEKNSAKNGQPNKQLHVLSSKAMAEKESSEHKNDDDDIGNSYLPFSNVPVSPVSPLLNVSSPLNRSREREAGDTATSTASSCTTTLADPSADEGDEDDAAFNEVLASFKLK